MKDAPECLGRLFVRAVQQRNTQVFQDVVGQTRFFWGVYFYSEQLTDQDRDWAIANRPGTEDSAEYRLA